MKKKIRIGLAAVMFLALLVLCHCAGQNLLERMNGLAETYGGETGAVRRNLNMVVLDPGHGGEDGGKTGVNGAEEKDINLKIASAVKTLLEEEGLEVAMTRNADQRLGDTQTEDLKYRVDFINEKNAFLTVSIHQNSYHEQEVNGAQVFYYADSGEGKKAAEIMQAEMGKADSGNTKEAKANTTYYILKNTEAPVIIAECGFLSNYAEAERLAGEEYQQEMAEVITKAILTYRKEYNTAN